MKTAKVTQKLIEICNHTTDDHSIVPLGYNIENLSAKQLKEVEAVLIDHFKFSKVNWMEYPMAKTEDNDTVVVAQSMILSDEENPDYEGKVCYMYNVTFSPKMYNPEDLHKPVKDGCVFAPLIYDPKTFEPSLSITLTWSPEFPQDIDAPPRTKEDDNQTIRDLLDKVLANPEDYRPEPYVRCMLRFAVV